MVEGMGGGIRRRCWRDGEREGRGRKVGGEREDVARFDQPASST